MKYKNLIYLSLGVICNATTTKEDLLDVLMKTIENIENIENIKDIENIENNKNNHLFNSEEYDFKSSLKSKESKKKILSMIKYIILHKAELF